MGKACRITVFGRGEKQTIDLCDTEEELQNMRVWQLKRKIARHLGKDEDDLRLIFRDRSLNDDSARLSRYGVENKSLIHVVEMFRVGAPSSSRSPSPSQDDNCLIL